VKFGIAIALASLFTLAGYSAAATALTLPAFHDGMAAPKTIAVVVAHQHRIAQDVVSAR